MNPAVERKKKSRGRQKIQIKRIEKEEARQVCFSKRRNGLFKKASELCILCGAQVAVVAFSPSGKPFTYGHPSDDDVFRRFLTGSGVVPSEASSAAELSADLNAEMMQLSRRLEAENQRRSLLEAALGAPWPAQKPFWWDADVNSMGMEELGEYHLVLQELHAAITRPPVEVELSSPLQQSDQTTDDELFQEIWDDYFLEDESISSSVQVGLSPPPHQQECVDHWTTVDELSTFQVGLSPPVQVGLSPTPQQPDQWTPGDDLFEGLRDVATDDYDLSEFCYDL